MSAPFLYDQSLALLTDLYQLTMAYGYWKNGLDKYESVFNLFFRKKPFGGGFTIAAGLQQAVEFIERFKFQSSDLDYLATLKGVTGSPLFCDEFLTYLSELSFSGSIDAVPEGSVVFPFEPILRIQAPLIQAQLLETALLNQINFATIIATKAARIAISAGDDPVMEFGLRRAQGIDGAMTASRSAYIGGCHSTSNVLAGKLYGIPVQGTHSHSWVMIFDDEIDAFKAFAKALPTDCVFLVDTYNSIKGVEKAIEVGKTLAADGYRMVGIRLDSGDLAYLSITAREMLDKAGFTDAKIVASNELDEILIGELKRQGAQIAVWGVGTNLITAKDQPALDGVYKLSAVRKPGEKWKYRLKLSEQMTKISNPGILQVRRYIDNEEYIGDMIYDIETGFSDVLKIIDPFDATRQKRIDSGTSYQDLLQPIYRDGELVYKFPTIHEVRGTTKKELLRFHSGVKRFLNPHQYVVGMEENLYNIKFDLVKGIRQSGVKNT